MKEQLAAMTIIELVRTAHSYATSIQQIDTHSAIVREMASRLEALNLAYIGAMNNLRSATSTIDQLAAENAALTKFIDDDCWVIDPDRDSYIDAAQCVPDTPATNAFLREQMAKGVENFAGVAETMLVKFANSTCSHAPEAIAWNIVNKNAKRYAAKLRAGEAV